MASKKVVGEVRASQLMFTNGVGSIIDLPHFSALILGLNEWEENTCPSIKERRLLAAVKECVGHTVQTLRLPPSSKQNDKNASSEINAGIPVASFPRWMRCARCGRMATIESGIFKQAEYEHQICFVHENCYKHKGKKGMPSIAVPVRFLLACKKGHLSDLPWVGLVHNGSACSSPRLTLNEFGVSGNADDIRISCDCGASITLSKVIDKLKNTEEFSACSGLFPHIRMRDSEQCKEKVSLLALGASNLWFPLSLSVLSLPELESDKINELVNRYWDDLCEDDIDIATIRILSKPKHIPELALFPPEEILKAIQRAKKVTLDSEINPKDIKLPEWKVLTSKVKITDSKKFELRPTNPPKDFEQQFESIALVPRLMEVRAMYGFTRIETQQELDLGIVQDIPSVQLTSETPTWLPACKAYGEGVFLRFREDWLQKWENRPEVQTYSKKFFDAHREWRAARKKLPHTDGFPGIRFILLHSLSHALMQQMVLDCGYTAASVRERIYCRRPQEQGGPMAGVLLYTASPDSDGTLGGLVSLGESEILSRYISQALESMRICTSDPLCSEHSPNDQSGRGIHGAACHTCLFSPETSCECGNMYLDRNLLVETFNPLSQKIAAF